MINYILLAIFIILQFLDFWTTYNVIKSGKGHEGNPVMAWLFSKIGVIGGFAAAKFILIVLFAYLATKHIYIVLFNLINLDFVPLVFILFNIIYVYVVYINYRILKS